MAGTIGKRKNVEGIEEMSKGSRPRQSTVSQEELAARHTEIFGKKEPKPRWVPPPLPEDMQNIESSYNRQLGQNVPQGRT
jgi:hypothetical protein